MACTKCGFSLLHIAFIPTSPHPELLVSGIPSSSEAAAIQTAIDTANQNIRAIEGEMERLGRALNEHSARRRELQEFCLKQRSVLSPLRKLPNDLLVEIFLLCREEFGYVELRHDPRWMITRVCGTWREVAVSTPRLWVEIEVFPWSRRYTSDRCLLLLLSQQIQWSGALPLSLQWDLSSEFSRPTRRSILDLFLSVAHRWQDANLAIRPDDHAHLSQFSGSFPLLRKLELMTDLGSPGRIFLACPLLQHLKIPSSPFSARFEFPSAQLRICHFLGSYPAEVLAILHQTTNLVEAVIQDVHGRSDALMPAPTPTMTSATLQRLTISNYGSDAGRLLGALSAPALQRLVVENCLPGFDIITFVPRCRSTLTHLRFQYTRMTTTTLLLLLPLTPYVTHLVVHGAEIDMSATSVGALTGAVLVPHLESISISGVFNCDNDLIVKMLRSRSAATGAGALRSARLLPIYRSPIIPYVDELRAEGLDVVCVDPDH
ncbi:hypothetical protein B0H13DRAFT_2041980 [Mycena leptocephala]|nr:hypothetical protein B0H13DRAFT_2041980 [Mycena leptocephala]